MTTTRSALQTRPARPALSASPSIGLGTQFRIPATYGYKPTFEVVGVRGDHYDAIDINQKVGSEAFRTRYAFSKCNFEAYAERGELIVLEER